MIAHPLLLAALAALWIALTVSLWRSRRWLAFYITGSLGFVLVALSVMRTFGIDAVVEGWEATQVVAIANAVGMRLGTFGGSSLSIPTDLGWAVFDIGIECSALLETFVFVGLIGFYPAFSPQRKAATMLAGVIATWVVNIARILLIIAIINAMGMGWVYSAHAVFGRVFFFTATIIVYWYLLTRPTISVVSAKLSEAADG